MLRPQMQQLFQHGLCSPAEGLCNTSLYDVCVNVEHSYKNIKQYRTSQNFCESAEGKRGFDSSDVSCKLFIVDHKCLYKRCEVQHQYQLRAQSIEEYLEVNKKI